ncbi:MAG: hypothetical protein JWP59_3630 [Massilia sp.]|nr:hypothetical protein [Massilia sp.]
MAAGGYVLVDVGAVLMAVPVQDVVQGVAWPERLDLLPRRADGGAACGVFDYHGRPLAMLDLARWVQLGGAAPDHQRPRRYARALIVQRGAQMVAIAVDAVRGLRQVEADALTRISHDDDQAEIFHSVARCPGVEGVANVLDVARLMALARTWSAGAEAEASVGAAAQSALAGAACATYAVVAGNGCGIAFPAADLLEVLPAPTLDPFQSPLTEGLCLWRGRHLPVTSVARCFPALAANSRGAPLLAVFERDGLALGVLVDQVPTIRSFEAAADSAALSAVADAVDADAEADAGRLVHLVGMAALYARFPERALSRAAGAAVTSGAAVQTNRSSHIVFDADGVASTPIDGIEAVLPLPALAPGATHMPWRGRAIALHDLRAAASPPSLTGTVIVVKGEQAPLGLIVDGVQALVQPRAGRVSRLAMAGRGVVDLLTIGSAGAAGGQSTYSTRNLAQLAQTLG